MTDYREETEKLDLKNGIYPAVDRPGLITMRLMVIPTGERRCPKKGEYYLSGAIIEGYRAPNDLSDKFYIAKLVKVKQHQMFEVMGDVVKYCIATESGRAKEVAFAILAIDLDAVIDPEGNPARMWATTIMTPTQLLKIDYVEDIVESCEQP